MDYKLLKTLINSNQEALKYYESLDDINVASVLNRRNQRGPVPLKDLSSFVVNTGILGEIEALDEFRIGEVIDSNTNIVMTKPLKKLLKTVSTAVDIKARLETAHMDEPSTVEMVNGLVFFNILSPELKTLMLTLADNRLSITEVQLGLPVTADDVSATRGI